MDFSVGTFWLLREVKMEMVKNLKYRIGITARIGKLDQISAFSPSLKEQK